MSSQVAGKPAKSRPLSARERSQWAELGHLLILQAMSEASEWSSDQFAFHGGTSLHLSWNSPRFSEDLDFLLDERAAERMHAVVERATQRMRQALLLVDPELVLELKDKSNPRMGHFQFLLGKPGVLGKAMVKAEFWRVPPRYLASYETTPRTPAIPLDLGGVRLRIDAMMPAATLESALADKLTAFATRPHLKWRDLFDHWWIRRQPGFVEPRDDELLQRFLHHVSAYECVRPGDPAGSLRAFAERISAPEVVAAAEQDLKPFVPEALWKAIWPAEVRAMVESAAAGARHLAQLVESAGERDARQAMAAVKERTGDDQDGQIARAPRPRA